MVLHARKLLFEMLDREVAYVVCAFTGAAALLVGGTPCTRPAWVRRTLEKPPIWNHAVASDAGRHIVPTDATAGEGTYHAGHAALDV